MKSRLPLFLLLVGLCSALPAETARLLLLHTNDLHDHVRPGYDGVGGLPYVAGYIAAERAQHPDLLLLDAGDVNEKGDLVAHRSHGLLTYEAMRSMGYDGVTVGNHDDNGGMVGMRRAEAALGQSFLCINFVDAHRQPLFTASRIVRKGEVTVGLIGLSRPHAELGLTVAESGQVLAAEAARVRPHVDVLIAVCHEVLDRVADWSQQAPGVDLFVTGHQHLKLEQAVQVPETGAWIVQAGYYARWVGRAELDVDLERRRLVGLTNTLVEMAHDTTPVDAALLATVKATETQLAPEASDFVMENHEAVTGEDLAWLAADALRQAARVEIGFCHAGQVLRATLPQGPVDVNAVFLTGGQRGEATLTLSLTGAEIEAYLVELAQNGSEPANWAGFGAVIDGPNIRSTLEPDRLYRVIMPQKEWDTRFLRAVKRQGDRGVKGPLTSGRERVTTPSELTFTSALAPYLKQLAGAGVSLRAEAAAMPTRGLPEG